jgi:glycosyltransferase involved in cell wall biosynthesis
MTKEKRLGVCIVSFPLVKAFEIPILNLSNVFSSITDTYVIIGAYDQLSIPKQNNIAQIHLFPVLKGPSLVKQIFRYGILNLKIMFKILSLQSCFRNIVFFMQPAPIFPMLLAKIVHKKIFWLLPSNIDNLSRLPTKINSSLSKICFSICNYILVYSSRLIYDWHLDNYRNKILVTHNHFLDFEKFKLKKPLKDRDNLVGYIGRFSHEKGTLNFLYAIPLIRPENGIKFLVGGDGPLRPQVEYLIKNNLRDQIKSVGWINREDLPAYLNELKLLVLPSCTEGLPNIMLEAMACGTPVLATPVGSIPDVIKNNENGFIMANNSPECIAKNIISTLNNPHLELIAQNAYEMVKKDFTFEKAVELFREILI